MSSEADHSYMPSYAPFHITEDGFRVYETAVEGRFVCATPGYLTYRGTMKGVVGFIERQRAQAFSALSGGEDKCQNTRE